MRTVQITLTVDEHDPDPTVQASLSIDGAGVSSKTLKPDQWRTLVGPVCDALGKPAGDAIATVEQAITTEVKARETRATDAQRIAKAAAKAWTDATAASAA